MRAALGERRFPLHIYLSALFVTLVVAFAAVTITLQVQGSRRMLLASADTLFRNIEEATHDKIQSSYSAAIVTADLLANATLTDAGSLPQRLRPLSVLTKVLRREGGFSAVYIGYADGQSFLVRRLKPGWALTRSLAPPPHTTYMVESMADGASGRREGRFLFFDNDTQQLADRLVPDYRFDPRTRPWFRDAIAGGGTIVTAPYEFFTTGEAGITVAQRNADNGAVAAVDLSLSLLSKALADLRPTPSARLVILNGQGEIIADSDGESPAVTAGPSTLQLRRVGDLGQPALAALFADKPATGRLTRRSEQPDGSWQGFISRLSQPGAPLYLAVAAPRAELLAAAERIRNRSIAVSLVLVAIAVLGTFAASRLAARALVALTREAATIRALRFDKPVAVRSFIAEIDALAQTMGTMKSTIQRFLDIGAVLAGERRFDRLLRRILEETLRIAAARGGIVYLAEPDGSLKCAMARWDYNEFEQGPPPLDPRQDRAHPAIRATAEGAVAVSLSAAELAAYYPRVPYDGPLGLLAVPLRTRQGDLLGVLLLAQSPQSVAAPDQRDVLALVEAVSGPAAAAIDTQRLILEQKRLLEALIELTAGAIDRKSPYTGGHCQRVPALTKMLARAAEAARQGPFADFALSEAQWEELHIAAWLHDCGKVTSPEFVIDKATKLETIYDRLHEVRMRFEVLKREAEAACWQRIAGGAEREASLAELDALWRTLDDEFAFVAACNEGGEYMAPERIARLKLIAARRWTRTLDDRLGLSADERARRARTPATPLPAHEPLLADRPEHIFERPENDRLTPDNPWGFKIEVPEYLYNRGEVYNLSIGRGTLTAEDRYKINEHIIETIRMLSSLPFPRHLANVVEIAGGHHEKMDGTGYPRRLQRDEMSVPARMIAIADIFEALTAADRPYKKPKTLSEALAIMARMRDEAHIDPDLFELFLEAGVYRDFAAACLPLEQIDAVDPASYLRRTAGTAVSAA